MALRPPRVVSTPYGGRLTWILPGGTQLVAHLKDKMKIRHLKRWSQVTTILSVICHEVVAGNEIEMTFKTWTNLF